MATLTYSGELQIETCWCGMKHAVPVELARLQKRRRDDGLKQDGFYCPIGHKWIYDGESQTAVLERQLQRERANHDQTLAELSDARQERDHNENRRRAEKAAKTKLKKRIAAGVCPCCNRTFQNLARHIAGQHPEFVGDKS